MQVVNTKQNDWPLTNKEKQLHTSLDNIFFQLKQKCMYKGKCKVQEPSRNSKEKKIVRVNYIYPL
jgi:hypothetical protein